ncbi:leucine-rich repeat protein [Luteolibacter arcticus]|uniref:Leucine-rich repeat protein n=1 Tax=Luteolibacter arcticus TaxID=1581411 RepID=A0ABT3GT38_9BACT|nr:leucine-rich repeat protein [Luteolibacter arcticus]MCW1926662.1 leucine-rich repeat protein [Luteolibacter arcticus]
MPSPTFPSLARRPSSLRAPSTSRRPHLPARRGRSTTHRLLQQCALWIASLLLLGSGTLLAEQSGPFTYQSNGSFITITAYTSGSTVTIPSHIIHNGEPQPVQVIAANAFFAESTIVTVTIPDTVTEIRADAFRNCLNMTTLTIGSGVITIGDGAFSNCPRLVTATIPDSVAYLGMGAFAFCSRMTSVTLGQGITGIRPATFASCSALTDITLPDSVITIGINAFASCTGLLRITLPAGITLIDSGAFSGCTKLIGMSAPGEATIPETVALPQSLYAIGFQAFARCAAIEAVVLPEGLTSISEEAFDQCSSLPSVHIPSSVNFIGRKAFAACTSLLAFTVDPANGSYSAPDGVLCNQSGQELVMFPGGRSGPYVIPAPIIRIGPHSFAECRLITSVTIPNHVFTIGDHAFDSCVSLLDVSIGSGITSIGVGAFFDCESLEQANIPAGITAIPDSMFDGCGALPQITIPHGITRVGKWAFAWCISLTGVQFASSVIELDEGAFAGCGFQTLTLPSSLKSIRKMAFYDSPYLEEIIIPEGVIHLGGPGPEDGEIFGYCTHLTRAVIPGSVAVLGPFLFEGCESLHDVTLGNGITTIGESAFTDCSDLTAIVIPPSVTTIGTSAFYRCSLGTITLPGSVTTIGESAFFDCEPLELSLPDSITTIGESAFARCGQLESVRIGRGIQSIGSLAFEDCQLLEHVTFRGDAPASFGANVFKRNPSSPPVTLYYYEGSSGFTSPLWEGYASGMIPQAGTVTTGSANVSRAGATYPLELGDFIFQGDTITTGPVPTITLVFIDETIITPGADSSFRIDEYLYNPGDPGQNSSRFTLLQGSFDFTSGLIGQHDPTDVVIDTPAGSVGIHGTAFNIALGTGATEDLIGFTLQVTSGTVIFTNRWTGTDHEVAAGNSFHADVPAPSLHTIRQQLIVSEEDGITLQLTGYTDQPFTVQRSTNLTDWIEHAHLQPADLPTALDATAQPGETSVFFRLAR